MNTYWILAANGAEGEEGQVIQGGQAEEGQTEEMTTEDGSQQTPPADGEGQGDAPGFGFGQLLPLIIIFVVFYFLIIRGPKKRQQQHSKMVSSLKKNDRVRTIGGIYGTVIDIKDNELTIKIDENTNAKIKVSPGAIAEVVSDKSENK
ncbi:preprotein translocase subunit YajC [Anaerohalosphaera lusitana]|uniref:Sec translocon accessory complex subunit YajC n=1 Tax=Anaerohalosphaera lusitana TaxID=1936003 RepID=A0A1U9NM34_9BACT|nr:preprotein translocase subunit YajC [Anaerohalosphaera lusitana]AQT68867.1 preprotein translocase subunit YajC [Anaerohalosphaera lusitana]